MLPIYILSKYNIRSSSGLLFQWLNIPMRLCSSSSDSSDSDSDSNTKRTKSKKTYGKSINTAISHNKNDLESLLNNMISQNQPSITKDTGNIYLDKVARKLERTIDVAVKHKKKKDVSNKTNHVSYENKLICAAEDVANTLGGDKTKTTSDLLQKVLASRTEALKKEQSIRHELKRDFKRSLKSERKGSSSNEEQAKKSVIEDLLKEYNDRSVVENNKSKQLSQGAKFISSKLLQNNDKKRRHVSKHNNVQNINIWNGEPTLIFQNMGPTSPNIPELKTWSALQQKELKMLTTHSPANIYQELILWTEQGKLWKFPIDNEQGMEEEQNIHFAEHVFMERHLKGWCPKSGPIRHFMELVCNGLSKNPYMTVQEKINHILWYKEYFESKQDLLQELGAYNLEPLPDKAKEIEE